MAVGTPAASGSFRQLQEHGWRNIVLQTCADFSQLKNKQQNKTSKSAEVSARFGKFHCFTLQTVRIDPSVSVYPLYIIEPSPPFNVYLLKQTDTLTYFYLRRTQNTRSFRLLKFSCSNRLTLQVAAQFMAVSKWKA